MPMLAVYGALWIVQTLILKRMKRRMIERSVVAEAERITSENAKMWS